MRRARAATCVLILSAASAASAQPALPDGALARFGDVRLRHTNHTGQQGWFTPDGRLLVVGDGVQEGIGPAVTRVWDARTGHLVRTLDGQPVGVTPDGARVQAVTHSHDLVTYDLASGRVVSSVESEYGAAWAPRSPDLRLVLRAGGQGVLVALADAGRAVHDLRGSPDGAAFTPDASRLAVVEGGKRRSRVLVHDLPAGTLLCGIVDAPDASALALSPDGSRVAATSHRERLTRVWDLGPSGATRDLAAAGESLTFSPDGRLLAIAGADATRVFDVSTERRVHEWARSSAAQTGRAWTAFSSDGTALALGGRGRRLRLIELPAGRERFPDPTPAAGVQSLAVSPDGATLATGHGGGSLQLWSAGTRAPGQRVTVGGRALAGVCFSPDGRLLAVASEDGASRLFDVAAPGVPRPFVPPAGPAGLASVGGYQLGGPGAAAFSPDGRWWAATSAHVVHVRALRGEASRSLDAGLGSGEVRGVRFTPDGVLVTVGPDAALRGWDPATGEELFHLDLGARATCLALSPDRRIAATGLTLWDLVARTRRVLAPGPGPEATAFSPDGRLLVAATSDTALRVFEVSSGDELRRLRPGCMSRALAFSPDGSRLYSGQDDGTVLEWDVTALE